MNQALFKTVKIFPKINSQGGLRKKGIFKKSFPGEPLITIITATLNSEKYLEESIKSLHRQNYKNYEHIIIDGGSKDSTLDIIKKYDDNIFIITISNESSTCYIFSY